MLLADPPRARQDDAKTMNTAAMAVITQPASLPPSSVFVSDDAAAGKRAKRAKRGGDRRGTSSSYGWSPGICLAGA